jgi:hypothetical protein
LLIQYIHNYPPYFEAFSSIHRLRIYHAMVARDPLNVRQHSVLYFICNWNKRAYDDGCLLGCSAM